MPTMERSYVRGVCAALQEAGLTRFASMEKAAAAADMLAEEALPQGLPQGPPEVEGMPGEVPPEGTAALAENLIQLSGALQEGAQHAEAAAEAAVGGAPEAPPEAPPAPPQEAPPPQEAEAKEAAVKTAAAWLKTKLALPVSTGSTITGTDPSQTNEQANSANAEASLDAANRPGGAGYANVGVAGVGTQEASGVGAIASEKEHEGEPMGPIAVDAASSVTDAIKGAADMRELVKKIAAGTTLMPKAAPTADAATGEGKLDDANRPGNAGYANKGEAGVGTSSEAKKERAAAVGSEAAHPGTMGPQGVGGSNTAIQQIPGKKSAADETYLQNFTETANKYSAYLPPRLDADEKVAAVKYLMGLQPVERDKIAMHMMKTAEMPEGLAEYVAKEKGEEKKDGKKDDKKDDKKEEEKEAALVDAASVLSRLSGLVRGA